MEKITTRKLQKERTRQAIIEAANICFIRKGMAYTLITDICEEANVSVGSFYHYFKNKNDLIISQFKTFDMGFLDIAEKLIDEPNAIEALIQFAHFFSRDAALEEKNLCIEYLKARVSLTVEQLYPQNRPYYIILCTVIANGQKRHQIRQDMTPWDIADLVMTVTRGYNFDWASKEGNYCLKERMNRDIPMLFSSLQWNENASVCQVENPIPEQNVPQLYKEAVEQLREYCLSRLI